MFHSMGLVQIQIKFSAENKPNNIPQKAPECISVHLKLQIFCGGSPEIPLECGGLTPTKCPGTC